MTEPSDALGEVILSLFKIAYGCINHENELNECNHPYHVIIESTVQACN